MLLSYFWYNSYLFIIRIMVAVFSPNELEDFYSDERYIYFVLF